MSATIHPLFCSPTRCEADFGGGHTAEPEVVLFDSESPAFGQVRLWQRTNAEAPRVELTVGDMDSGKRCRADFTLSQARQLRDLLSVTLAKVDA